MEKRTGPRYDVEAPAILRVHGRAGPFLVTILDVSPSGLRLSSPTAFPSGARVTIKCRGANVTGEIRYARAVEHDGYHLGILADGASGGAVSETGDLDLTLLFSVPTLASKSSTK